MNPRWNESTGSPRQLYALLKLYGRRKLAGVLAIVAVSSLLQMASVASVFPFLAIASDPDQIRNSRAGAIVLARLPDLSNETLLIVAGCLTVIALVVANAVQLVNYYILAAYLRGCTYCLSTKALDAIIKNDYAFFLSRSTGALMRKVNGDVQMLVAGVVGTLLVMLSGALNVLLMLVALISVDPLVATVSVCVVGLLYVAIFRAVATKATFYGEVLRKTNSESNRQLVQLLSGIKPIKIHGLEQVFLRRYAKLAWEQVRAAATYQVVAVAPKNLIEPVALGVLVAIVIVYIAQGKDLNAVLPGLGMMAFAAYRILPNAQSLYASALALRSQRYVVQEVYEEFSGGALLTGAGRIPEVAPRLRLERGISLSGVVFGYPGSIAETLKGVDLAIDRQQSVAIVGTTGCGKSTLVDLILGLHVPVSGEIRVDGVLLSADNVRGWQASIGYVPQDIFLLDDSIAANIALGAEPNKINRQRLREACANAQILDYVENELPDQFETQVGERGVRLSGGQRQRIGLARALYRQPDVLILDEATSALDNQTEADVMKSIKKLRNDLTIIIVAHRLSTIRWCDRVVELESGKIAKIASGDSYANFLPSNAG